MRSKAATSSSFSLVVLLMAGAMASSQAIAQTTITWNGNKDDNFNNSGNYVGKNLPGTSDIAAFAATTSNHAPNPGARP